MVSSIAQPALSIQKPLSVHPMGVTPGFGEFHSGIDTGGAAVVIPVPIFGTRVAGRGSHGHAPCHERPRAAGTAGSRARSACRRPHVIRGRRGDLVRLLWHDGLSMSLYAMRLECGRFIWPTPADGSVAISTSQLTYMLEGIDWRHPQRTWRPEMAGRRDRRGSWV